MHTAIMLALAWGEVFFWGGRIFIVCWPCLAFCVGMISKRRSFAFWPYFVLSLLASPILALITVYYFFTQAPTPVLSFLLLLFFLSLFARPMIALATLRFAVKLTGEKEAQRGEAA